MGIDFRLVDSVTSRQLGLITTQQWFDEGGTPDELRWAVRRGRVITVRRGVHRMAGAPLTREQVILAACLAGGPYVVASHGSTGELWRTWGWIRSDAIELTAFDGRHPRLLGVRTHRVDRLPMDHRRVHGGIPVTSPARTICDLAPRLHGDVLEKTIDDAQRRRLLTLPELYSCAVALANEGRPMMDPIIDLVSVLQMRDPGGSRSELRILDICRSAGIELPQQQVHLEIAGIEVIPDYFWSYPLVVVEYDGGAHWTPSAKRRDRRKRNLYASAGIIPLDFGDADSDTVIREQLAMTLDDRRRLADAGLLPPTTARILDIAS